MDTIAWHSCDLLRPSRPGFRPFTNRLSRPVRRVYSYLPRPVCHAFSRARCSAPWPSSVPTSGIQHKVRSQSRGLRVATASEQGDGNGLIDGSNSEKSRNGSDKATADYQNLPRSMVAAMALSPFAAMSLEMLNNPAWREQLGESLDRAATRTAYFFAGDRWQEWRQKFDEGATFMDWTYPLTGVDLTQVWDPEMWVFFREAIRYNSPALLWNKLLEKIEYTQRVPQAGLVGDMRLSYAKFLDLLHNNRIKRITVYGDLKTAVVEIPQRWWATINGAPGVYPYFADGFGNNLSVVVPDPDNLEDPDKWFAKEMPEWNQEKFKFYVDLPGDFWASETLTDYIKSRIVKVYWDEESREYVVPRSSFNRMHESKTELQLLDPRDSWDFMNWLTSASHLDWYEKMIVICLLARGLCLAIDFVTGSNAWQNYAKKKKKKDKESSMWERLTSVKSNEFKTKDGKAKDTGIRFKDIAGLDDIVFQMREVVKLLLKDPAYVKVGAKCPRGVIFQGPPGTGKTYLARAIAGEAGVTFYSAVGSEFVEMFAGIAAARVNNLFNTARERSPAIIFIDEIDAIGRSRSLLSADPGSQEREQALLAMLVQMDGIHSNTEAVLTIGATNLASELDPALLRPGRFELTFEIGNPEPLARFEILKYHAKNKKLDNELVLLKVAEVTEGYSAAALANLMNEAAILTVRRNVPSISQSMLLELVDSQKNGPPAPMIPPSAAKDRLAVITAAKAVAFALTPGIDMIDKVSLWSKRQGVGPYVEFLQSDKNLTPGWHPEQTSFGAWQKNYKVNAAEIGDMKLGEFYHLSLLLLPLYAPRCCEVSYWGDDQASLATGGILTDCFEIAFWTVRNSFLHPKFKRMPPLHTYLAMGSDLAWQTRRDKVTQGMAEELGYHKMALTLLKAAYKRATQLVLQRRPAIEAVAQALLTAEDETITGAELVAIIESTPLADSSGVVIDNQFMPFLKQALGNTRIPGVILQGIQELEAEEAAKIVAMAGQRGGRVLCAAFTWDAGTMGTVGTLDSPAPLAQGISGQASFRAGAGRPGDVSFYNQLFDAFVQPLVLDESSVSKVARALMGRLDMTDLIGKNTTQDLADRVIEALHDPPRADRLRAMSAWADEDDAPFPPPPALSEVPEPPFMWHTRDLDAWKQRNITNITWNALDWLFTEKQQKLYKEDQDLPDWSKTTSGRLQLRFTAALKEIAAKRDARRRAERRKRKAEEEEERRRQQEEEQQQQQEEQQAQVAAIAAQKLAEEEEETRRLEEERTVDVVAEAVVEVEEEEEPGSGPPSVTSVEDSGGDGVVVAEGGLMEEELRQEDDQAAAAAAQQVTQDQGSLEVQEAGDEDDAPVSPPSAPPATETTSQQQQVDSPQQPPGAGELGSADATAQQQVDSSSSSASSAGSQQQVESSSNQDDSAAEPSQGDVTGGESEPSGEDGAAGGGGNDGDSSK